jgi:hypothetical protein
VALIDDIKIVAGKYVGKESERFIDRQCRAHLKVEPVGVNRSHLAELARWVGISGGLILSQDQAEAFKQEILDLC